MNDRGEGEGEEARVEDEEEKHKARGLYNNGVAPYQDAQLNMEMANGGRGVRGRQQCGMLHVATWKSAHATSVISGNPAHLLPPPSQSVCTACE